MNTLYKLILVAFFGIFATACTDDFEEINSNPNQPERVGADLLLPTLIADPATSFLGNDAWSRGNVAMQISAVNNFTTFDQMGWGGGNWDVFYRGMRDAQTVMEIGQESGNAAYQGIALTLQSWMVSILTDQYGDVPFAEANAAKDGNFSPTYDSQESIYNKLLEDLTRADGLLAQGGAIGGDLLYQGDISKWRKFANSLNIRLLMRLENKRGGTTIGADIQNILNSRPVFESSDDDASFPYLATAPNQNPRHSGRVGGFDEKRMSQKAELRMKAINDPRLLVYFRPVDNPDTLAAYFGDDLPGILAGFGMNRTAWRDFLVTAYNNDPESVKQYYNTFKGLPNGLSENNAIIFNGSRQNQSRLGEIIREMPDGVAMHYMTYAELQFILAEAATKGYISGDAEEFYLNGINAAMGMYDLTPAASYFTQEAVSFSPDTETALDQIATQKWMALFYNGMEAYFDWRRTGRPAIEPGADNLNANRVPLRFVYPGAEQALNGDNWKAAVDRIGGDDNINAVMWLLQ